jgi:hypothetical protein
MHSVMECLFFFIYTPKKSRFSGLFGIFQVNFAELFLQGAPDAVRPRHIRYGGKKLIYLQFFAPIQFRIQWL